MASREELLERVATIIADYRAGEIASPDAARVSKWVEQFPAAVQEPILAELAHVLGKTYFTKSNVREFLAAVVANKKFAGADPCAFWKGVKFLDLQTAGNSQRDMLAIFEEELRKACGLSLSDCGAKPHTYVYIDDALYSGGRIGADLVKWVKGPAPAKAKVAVITIAIHRLGEWFAGKNITQAAKDAGKDIDVGWWCVAKVENRKAYRANSDVLWPDAIPAHAETAAYIAGLGTAPVLRTGTSVGALGVFSSHTSRKLLEQEFLVAGVKVRAMCPHFNVYMRPLGSSLMKTPGFGSTIVTYRNCANNTPLVLWAGDPWYPLFPRKTN